MLALSPIVIGGGETWIALIAGRTLPDALLYGIIAAAATSWMFIMAKLLWAQWPFAARDDVAALKARAKEQDRFARLAWTRIGHLTDLTALLTCERALDPIDRHIAALEEQLDLLVQPASLFPSWQDAAHQWLAIAGRLLPDIAAGFTPFDQHAARRVRHSLPHGQNLSSADIKAAVAYRLQREQLAGSRDRLSRHRETVLSSNALT